MSDYYDTSYPPSLWDGSGPGPAPPPTPTLTAVNPNTGTTGEAVTITVTGTNFVDGASIMFAATPYPTTFVSETELRADVAALPAAGPYSVAVNNGGGVVSNVMAFTVNAVTPEEPEDEGA